MLLLVLACATSLYDCSCSFLGGRYYSGWRVHGGTLAPPNERKACSASDVWLPKRYLSTTAHCVVTPHGRTRCVQQQHQATYLIVADSRADCRGVCALDRVQDRRCMRLDGNTVVGVERLEVQCSHDGGERRGGGLVPANLQAVSGRA